ncbi:MAG: hypothetical protein IJX62_07995 [Clostridia bacterium]|nr:hypothetical protein [Clostridia bacterium]
MKKHLIIVSSALVIVSIIVIVFGLCYKQVNYSTFHFSPMMCEATFDGMSPEDFCTNNGEGTFLKDKYLYAEVDIDGCLILTLENDIVNEWKNTFVDLQVLQCVLGNSHDIGVTIDYSIDFMDYMKDANTCGFEISEDFTKIIASPEDNHWYYPLITLACARMQVFEGKNCTEVKVSYIDINDKGEVISTAVFPNDANE